jgi:putative ABC transport system permease protein
MELTDAIALPVATPVAWYGMQEWLGQFTYRISVSSGVFLLAGGEALLVALLTVAYQSLKAAITNPVESLQSE